jgi:hypothetical protein
MRKTVFLSLICYALRGETRRMFIRNEIVETEESLREFVAPNPISCGRFLNPKSEGFLPYEIS